VTPPPPVVVTPPPPAPVAAAPARPPTLKQRTENAKAELKETVDEVGTALEQVVVGLGNTLVDVLGPPPPAPAP
jgi:hypothetical protein